MKTARRGCEKGEGEAKRRRAETKPGKETRERGRQEFRKES
jgi:hypothetical protein